MKLKKEIKIDETNIDFETVVNNCIYSSEEKVIGKWFGKKHYRLNIEYSSTSTTPNIPIPNNIDKITFSHVEAADNNHENTTPIPTINNAYASGSSRNRFTYSIYLKNASWNANHLYIVKGNDDGDFSDFRNYQITLEYTKITD